MQLDCEDAALLACIGGAFGDVAGTADTARIGVAVSGGGDSVALLHLVVRWAQHSGASVAAVTVDHGLRAQSRSEAEGVAALCAALGIEHDILTWARPAGAGNLAALARDARYGLMADWARARGVGRVALGHTADDSAENFLMRLGRSAGVDGLAEMEAGFNRAGVAWLRPLAGQTRDALRAYLRRHSVSWVEDPSNDDRAYLRSRARQVLPALGDLGITAAGLRHSASALRQARDALAHYTRQEAAAHVQEHAGDVLIPAQPDPEIPPEIMRRLLAAGLQWVGSSPYPPRKITEQMLEREMAGQLRKTVAGCVIMRRKGMYQITREYNAVKDLVTTTDAVWDTRWRLDGPHEAGLEVRALGDGIGDVPDWRKTGLARRTLMASPSVWQGARLVAAPVARYNPLWNARIVADFTSFLLSH